MTPPFEIAKMSAIRSRVLRINLQAGSLQCLQTRCGGESRNQTGSTKTRMRQTTQRRLGYAERTVRSIPKLFGNRCRGRLIAMKQPVPYWINAIPKRGHPPHSGDRQTHASTLRIRIEAFVPPKPNEFESAVRNTAGRDSFATTFRSRPSSKAPKLMFGGRN